MGILEKNMETIILALGCGVYTPPLSRESMALGIL